MSFTGKLFIIFLTFLALTSGTCVAASTPTPLPPAAQEALNKGIIAAKVPDYLLAIRYFEEARKITPEAPVIYLNMGLAESRIPGRELRAIAWFGAYLAAYPGAPNAEAVKEQIAVLEVRNQSNLSRLIKSLQNAAIQNANFRDVAKLYAEAGDIAGAHKAADLTLTADWKRAAQTAIAEAQIRVGDIAGAQKTLTVALATADLIVGDAESKSMGQSFIAEAQIKAGDIAGAKNTLASALITAGLIKDANYKSYAQRTIAEVQIKAGDVAGAQKTLAFAHRTADIIGDAKDKTYQLAEIAETQVNAGDIARARETLVSALQSAAFIQDAYWKINAPGRIAQAQIIAGDIAGAQKTADEIQRLDLKQLIQSRIIQAKADTGNAPSATRQSAPDTQPSIQHVVTASDWLKKLDDDNKSNDCPLNTGFFLDLPGHLKSLPASDNPRIYFDTASFIAEKLVRARNAITGMLKQQAKR